MDALNPIAGSAMAVDSQTSAPFQKVDCRTAIASPLSSFAENLIVVASRGLVSMFDKSEQLFCHRLIRTERRFIFDRLSPRYTIMTLLGLRQVEHSGASCAFDTNAIYEVLVRDSDWIQCAGDLGLMIWLVATFAPDQIQNWLDGVDLPRALDRFPDARELRTTELAWFLAGVSHAAIAAPKLRGQLTDVAVETYRNIIANQGEHGFFGHMNGRSSLAGFIRGRIGSFADQIYPIYSLAKFARAFDITEPIDEALKCASAICKAQGEMGQWWWLYDSRTGRVSSRYPVYSVHQHGMAPMGLFALEEITRHTFQEQIDNGLKWIFGNNEVHTDMRDSNNDLIWRCVRHRSSVTKYLDVTASIFRSKNMSEPASLEILYEERPYEFGWLLYAFAKRGMNTSFPKASECVR